MIPKSSDHQQQQLCIENPFPPVSESPVFWGKNPSRAYNHKAIVNPDTGKVFSIVSKDYRLIRHEDAIADIERGLGKFHEIGRYVTTTEFYNDGARMRRKYRFFQRPVEIRVGDVIYPELNLYNSYDVTWPLVILFGAFRVVCSNGLVIGKKFLHLRRRHVFEWDSIEIENRLAEGMELFRVQSRYWKRWTRRQLTPRTYKRIMDAMKLGVKARDEIEDEVARGSSGLDENDFPVITLWAFFNVLTWYVSHRAASLNHQVEMEGRLRNAIDPI